MNKLLIATALLSIGVMNAHAGLRFNHMVYECQNEKGVKIQVLKPGTPEAEKLDLAGQMLAFNVSSDSAPKLGVWCGSKVKEGKIIKISDRELIAETPNSCKFVLNTKKLTATIQYKEWRGYVGGYTKPEVNTEEELKCEVRNEIVNY